MLDVSIPVYNEEADLAPCVQRLHAHLATTFPYPSGSRSPTTPAPTRPPLVARGWPTSWPTSRAVRLERRAAAARCKHGLVARPTPTVLAYMDVDLSTDLNALLPLVAPLISRPLGPGHRLPAGSRHAGWCAAPSGR